jgi:hypothetical protein
MYLVLYTALLTATYMYTVCCNTTAGPVYIIAGVLSFAFAHRVGVDIGALVPASAGSGLKSTVSKVHMCTVHDA